MDEQYRKARTSGKTNTNNYSTTTNKMKFGNIRNTMEWMSNSSVPLLAPAAPRILRYAYSYILNEPQLNTMT